MNLRNSFGKAINLLLFLFSIFGIAALFMRPDIAFKSIKDGLYDCYTQLIPSLFPFMVLSGMLMLSPFAKYLGSLLYPYIRLLGIKSNRAPLAMLLGLIGGFSVGAQSISALYENGKITKRDAELLLCCTVGIGPAFTVSVVGFGMFNSIVTGALIYTALFISNLIIGVFLSLILPKNNMPSETALQTKTSKKNMVDVIKKSTMTILILCGFVTAFRFFSAIALPQNAPVNLRFAVCCVLEVTSACNVAMKMGSFNPYFACTALSVMGMSAFLQVKYICNKSISVVPLLASRLLHLPISLGLLKLFFICFPYRAKVFATDNKALYLHFRMPPDAMLVLFLLCIVIFLDFAVPKHLRKHKKSL